MILYRGRQYRQAADPQRDKEFRQQAAEAYRELKQKIDNGEMSPIDRWGPKGALGFQVDLSPFLKVTLLPPTKNGLGGSFGSRGSQGLLRLYVGAWEGFWDQPIKKQLELLPHVVIPERTFLHEYTHSWMQQEG